MRQVTIDGGAFLPTAASGRYAEVLLEWSGRLASTLSQASGVP